MTERWSSGPLVGFRWYTRDGKESGDLLEWGRLMSDAAYQRVAETTLDDGKWVSTVWLGIDHRFGIGGEPLIFETMVFKAQGSSDELDVRRYATEAEARAGHAGLVALWGAKRAKP